MNKFHIYIFGILVFAASCQSFTRETSCYKNYGGGNTSLQLVTEGDSVSGYMVVGSEEQGTVLGSLSGRREEGYVTVLFKYTIGGEVYKSELVFKEQGDQLIQGHGEMEMVDGVPRLKDKSKAEWRETFEKADCSGIQSVIDNANEAGKTNGGK